MCGEFSVATGERHVCKVVAIAKRLGRAEEHAVVVVPLQAEVLTHFEGLINMLWFGELTILGRLRLISSVFRQNSAIEIFHFFRKWGHGRRPWKKCG